MSSIPGVGGPGGIDPARAQPLQPTGGMDPGAAKLGFDKLVGPGQADPSDAARVLHSPLIASLREAAQQGLSSQHALEQIVRKQLEILSGGSAPPAVVQQVLDAIRNDPSMARILERIERASGHAQ